ncbi:hypothetical protein JCM7686_pAMI4p214 (plasmid) [Paracoccus aminophilus JCM 7686]|uniref:Anaphase-promoting complex subunit 4-like WD40 domain-containing protein n=1 Tax=Paracoccus aminophilus JCM 7686 TaxID=1367847 RepID=S5Y5A9_PARAH|nr:hypothetical protein JCM7686_pAMI4p214 [Paracoccus aminophilus JCM 7686]
MPPQNAPAPTGQSALFDLLARSWSLDAPIRAVALDRQGKAAAFALADGRIALMALEDEESALSRMRVEADSGRSTIRPRGKPVAQPILTPALAEGAPLLAVSGLIGFIAASADGRLHRVTPRGQIIALTDRRDPIFAIASDQAGRLALARADRVDLHAEEGMVRQADLATPDPATALAFAPGDGTLAVMSAAGLRLFSLGKMPEERPESLPLGGRGALVFSGDGHWLAGANGQDGIWLLSRADGRIARIGKFRAPPASLAFAATQTANTATPTAGGAVFASGAFRAAGWALATPPFESETTGALKTGRPGLVLIEQIAAHPRRDLIAIGTADGAVTLARVGQSADMPLRQADGSAVTALCWSADGLHLVIGTASGQAALVTLPEQIFK